MGLAANDDVEKTLKEMAQVDNNLSPYYALQLVKDEQVADPKDHTLRLLPEPGTVVVHRGDAILVGDNSGRITGFAGHGTVDYTTKKLSVIFDEHTDEPVTVDYEHDTSRVAS